MFVVPVWAFQSRYQQPKTYRKRIAKTSEVVGAKCRVRTIIYFLEKIIEVEKNGTYDGKPFIFIDYEHKKGEQYGFEVEVDLSKSEYEKNRINLEEYACEKVKEQHSYQRAVNDCIEKYADGRDYTIETFVPHDPNAIDVQFVHHEYEEYVPV